MFPECHASFVTIFFNIFLATGMEYSSNVLNRFDIVMCSESKLETFLTHLTSIVFPFATISNCRKFCDSKFIQNPTVLLWMQESKEELNLLKLSQTPRECEKRLQNSRHELYDLYRKQLVHHFIFNSEVNDSQKLFLSLQKQAQNSILKNESISEFFLCALSFQMVQEDSECIEIYKIKTKVIVKWIRLDSAITDMYTRRLNFYNEIIGAVSLVQPGLVGKKFKPRKRPDDPLEYTGGYNVEKIWYLKAALNFRERAMINVTSLTRNPKDDTLLNVGFAEMLNSDVADISLGQYEFVPFRMKGPYGMRYLLASLSSDKGLAFFVQPRNQGNTLQIYLRPFQFAVWKALSVMLYVIGIGLIVILRDESIKKDNKLLRIIWHIVEILTLKGGQNTFVIPAISCQLFIFTVLFSSFIFQGLYVSSFTSILAVNFDEITDLKGLLKSGYKLLLNAGSPILRPLVLTQIKSILKSDNNISLIDSPIDKGFNSILESKTALITGPSEFKTFLPPYYNDDFLCNTLSVVEATATPIKDGYVVRQGSPLRNPFNIKLLQFYQTGILKRLELTSKESTNLICSVEKSAKFNSMQVESAAMPLCLMAVGLCISILVLTLEILSPLI